MCDHNIFQDNLVGVDFPAYWRKRKRRLRRTADLHGYKTIADIMRALNPFTGVVYLEALQMSRMTREMFCLMEGRHVHPSTLYPGGVARCLQCRSTTIYSISFMRLRQDMRRSAGAGMGEWVRLLTSVSASPAGRAGQGPTLQGPL